MKTPPKIDGVSWITPKSATIVTAAMAEQMLKHNTNNRKPRRGHMKTLRRDMEKGRFLLSPDCIAFNKAGEMINGQQRCMVCVETGIPFPAFIVCGLDEHAYTITDGGAPRTLADRMRIARNTALIINQYCVHVLGMGWKVSAQEAELVYTDIADSIDFAAEIRPNTKGIGVGAIWAAATMYHLVDPVMASDFAHDFVAVSEIKQCNVLKNWLMGQKRLSGGQAQHEVLRRALYCMDAHFHSVSIQRIGKIEPVDAFKD